MSGLRDLVAGAARHEGELPPGVGTFLRGLSLGALVGAAIAGSIVLERRRQHVDARAARREAPPVPSDEPGGTTGR